MRKRIILPDHPFRKVWELFILVASILTALVEPYWLSVGYGGTLRNHFFEIALSLIFFADLYVRLHSAYTHRRQLIADPLLIVKHYRKEGFWTDLVAAIPFSLIVELVTLGSPVAGVFRITRLFKLLTANRYLRKLRDSNRFNPSVVRMTLLIFWILIAAHMITCAWMIVRGNPDFLSAFDRYLISFYWTITTLTTIGYGDITPETAGQTIFVIIVELLGAGMYGFIIGNISNLISNIDVAKTQYKEKREKVSTFMRYRNIPFNMQKKINDYYDYMWENRRGYDETSVLEELPVSLKVQVSLFLNKEIIEKVPFFKEASDEFIREIIMNLDPIVYTPGDYIMRKGEIGHTMYFIGKGSVDVVSEDEKIVYATLTEGQFVGEIALLLSVPRTATVKSKEYCDLYALDKEKFDKVLLKYPTFAESIQELAEERRREIEEAGMGKEKKQRPSKSTPPKKLKKVNGHIHNHNIVLEWNPVPGVTFYEIMKQNYSLQGDSFWKSIGRVFAETEFIDHECSMEIPNIYRIRGVNNEGSGEWSENISITFPGKQETDKI